MKLSGNICILNLFITGNLILMFVGLLIFATGVYFQIEYKAFDFASFCLNLIGSLFVGISIMSCYIRMSKHRSILQNFVLSVLFLISTGITVYFYIDSEAIIWFLGRTYPDVPVDIIRQNLFLSYIFLDVACGVLLFILMIGICYTCSLV